MKVGVTPHSSASWEGEAGSASRIRFPPGDCDGLVLTVYTDSEAVKRAALSASVRLAGPGAGARAASSFPVEYPP
jgi:hypothetical protein